MTSLETKAKIAPHNNHKTTSSTKRKVLNSKKRTRKSKLPRRTKESKMVKDNPRRVENPKSHHSILEK